MTISNDKLLQLFEMYFEANDWTSKSLLDSLYCSHGKINSDIRIKIKHGVHVTQIPVPFGTISATFDCSLCGLTTLEGGPDRVDGNFVICENKLTNLIGGPKVVKGVYNVLDNMLTSLEGIPAEKITTIWLSYHKDLPVLRLLTLKMVRDVELSSLDCHQSNKTIVTVNNIIKKYRYLIERGLDNKHAIWECQKELIENGLEGNAKW
jgi:hypothetical protein